MKKVTLIVISFVLMIFSGSFAFAQGKYGPDSAECIKYLSYYKEYYKQKNYDEAIPHWRKAFKLCPPTANQTMLVDGTSLMRYLINKNRSNTIYKESLVDTLLMIHDVRALNYPKYATTVYNNKGLDMINYLQDDTKKLYDNFKEVIKHNKANTKPQIFLFKINAACDLYSKGVITPEDVIADYEEAIGYINEIEKKDKSSTIAKIREDIESLFIGSKVASCDNLIALFTPRFEQNPDDLDIATKIVKMMSVTDGCTDNELYLNAALTMHRLNPNGSSAYFLYKLYSSKGDMENSVKYMTEAIESADTDNITDAKYNMELATALFKSGHSNVKALECAIKAVELDESLAGKAYYLIGTIWGSQICNGNEIEKRAPYWVAVDYLVKAKNADPSMEKDANALIGQYSSYFPQTAEAFMYDIIDGQSYTVSCNGMRATTTVRTQK